MFVQGISRLVQSGIDRLDQEIGIERVVLRAAIVVSVAVAVFNGQVFAAVGFVLIGAISHWAESKDKQDVIDDLREQNKTLSARNKGLEGERLKTTRLLTGLTHYRALARMEIARLKEEITRRT